MELTARMEYATLALVEMANHAPGAPLHASVIAGRQGIPRPYLDQLMLALRRAGLVRSVRGPKGGHQLARSPAELTLRDVYLALEGEGDGRSARRQRELERVQVDAGLRSAWERARERFLETLERTTVGHLAEALRRSGADSMYYI